MEQELFINNMRLFLEEVPPELFSQISQKMLAVRNDSSLKERLGTNSVLMNLFDNFVRTKIREVFKNNKIGIPS